MPYAYDPLFKEKRYESILAKLIRKERLDQNMSLIELAKTVGIDPSFLSAIENNKKAPSKLVADSLFDALGIDFDMSEEREDEFMPIFKERYMAYVTHGIIDTTSFEEYRYTLAFPLVLLLECVFHIKDISHEQTILDELCEAEDESYKIILTDQELTFAQNEKDVDYVIGCYLDDLRAGNTTRSSFTKMVDAIFKLHAITYLVDNGKALSAMQYTDEVQQVFAENVFVKGLLAIKEQKAKIFTLSGDLTCALNEYQELLNNTDIQKDDTITAGLLIKIGEIYFEDNNYISAIRSFKDSLAKKYSSFVLCYLIIIYYLIDDRRSLQMYLEECDQDDDLLDYRNIFIGLQNGDDRLVKISFKAIEDDIKNTYLYDVLVSHLYRYFKDKGSYEDACYFADRFIYRLS